MANDDMASQVQKALRIYVRDPGPVDTLATQLTASLGLKGFKLNLAVEAAQGLEGLVELLPRLHAAVGDERLRPLKRALEGR